MEYQRITIGGPVFNEEEGILLFLDRLTTSLSRIQEESSHWRFSLLLVNDGSTDSTLEKVRGFIQDQGSKVFDKIQVLSLSRNFGHGPAVTACLEHLDPGEDALILMDTDLQDPPELIGDLLELYHQGFDSVRVVRGRRPEGLLFSFFSSLFYRLFGKISHLPSGMGTFGLYDRKVLMALRNFPEKMRYLPGLISLVGFSTAEITADRSPRAFGKSHVGMEGLFLLAMGALFSFSTWPLHAIGLMGLVISFFSLLATLIVVGIKLFTDLAIPGWASLLGAQFFIGGSLLLGMGVLGHYIGVIFTEVKRRPAYFLRDVLQVDLSTPLDRKNFPPPREKNTGPAN